MSEDLVKVRAPELVHFQHMFQLQRRPSPFPYDPIYQVIRPGRDYNVRTPRGGRGSVIIRYPLHGGASYACGNQEIGGLFGPFD